MGKQRKRCACICKVLCITIKAVNTHEHFCGIVKEILSENNNEFTSFPECIIGLMSRVLSLNTKMHSNVIDAVRENLKSTSNNTQISTSA